MGSTSSWRADQRNYYELLESGFSPEQVSRIMSLNGARVLGEDERFGSIEPGKLADLVVIDGDAVRREAAVRNVTLVFKERVGYDAPALAESRAGAHRAAVTETPRFPLSIPVAAPLIGRFTVISDFTEIDNNSRARLGGGGSRGRTLPNASPSPTATISWSRARTGPRPTRTTWRKRSWPDCPAGLVLDSVINGAADGRSRRRASRVVDRTTRRALGTHPAARANRGLHGRRSTQHSTTRTWPWAP